MSTERRRPDRLLLAIVFLGSLGVPGIAVGIVLPELIDETGMGTTVAALHGSMFGFGMVLVGLAGTTVVRRAGRRRTLEGAAATIVIGIGVFLLGHVWPVTLLGAALAGIGTSIVATVGPSVVSDHFLGDRARVFALLSATPTIVGLCLAFGVGISLERGWSWRPVFAAVTVVLTVGLVVTGRHVELPETTPPLIGRRTALRSRSLRGGLVRMLVATFTDFGIGLWAVVYLHDVGGASTGAAAMLSTVMPICVAFGRLAVHRWVHRIGRAATSIAFAGTALGVVLLCVGPTLAARVAALAAIGLCSSALAPLTASALYDRVGDTIDSVTIATLAAISTGTAMWVGPVVLGVLADVVGLRWAVLFVSAMALVGAFLHVPRRSPAILT